MHQNEMILRYLVTANYKLNRIIRNQERTMAQIDDLNAAVDALNSKVTKLGTDSDAVLAELKQIQTSNPSVDLSGVIAKVQAISNSVDSIDANDVAAAVPTSTTPPATTDTPSAS